MKRFLLFTVLVSVLVSCSAKKQMESAISTGNYDHAINDALRKLKNNKNKKRKQDYVILLKDAYSKVLEEDLKNIAHLKKDGNPEQYKTIYETYLNLEARQNAVKRVLPLKINGKTLHLKFNDYSSEIVDYRYKTSDYLIDEGITLLDSNDKYNARKAYDIFSYIERINPNFEDGYYNLGVVYYELKNFEQAILYFQKSLTLNPTSLPATTNLGVCYKELHQYSLAIECFEKALVLDPNYSEAYFNLANVFLLQEKFVESLCIITRKTHELKSWLSPLLVHTFLIHVLQKAFQLNAKSPPYF